MHRMSPGPRSVIPTKPARVVLAPSIRDGSFIGKRLQCSFPAGTPAAVVLDFLLPFLSRETAVNQSEFEDAYEDMERIPGAVLETPVSEVMARDPLMVDA